MTMLRKWVARLALVAVSAGTLAACTVVNTQVDAYSAIPADLTPKTVYIAPGPAMNGDTLAFQQNAAHLGGLLLGKGFTPVTSPGAARLLASFSYDIDAGRRVTTQYSVPEHGIVGYRRIRLENGKTRREPVFGVIGYSLQTRTDTVYGRTLLLDMTDRQTGRPVFHALAVSEDTCKSLAIVIPIMLKGVLADFPAARSGGTTRSSDQSC